MAIILGKVRACARGAAHRRCMHSPCVQVKTHGNLSSHFKSPLRLSSTQHNEDNRHPENNDELPAERYERATGAKLKKQYLAERNTSQILVVRKDEVSRGCVRGGGALAVGRFLKARPIKRLVSRHPIAH